MDNKLPLRSEKEAKAGKRESRLGLRSLFGRHKSSNGDMDESKTARKLSRPTRPQPLNAEAFKTPSYGLQATGPQSEIHIAPAKDESPAQRPSTSVVKSPASTPGSPLRSPGLLSSGRKRGSVAMWDPVPLFQAWPQANKSATLPACVQADSLLKVHNRKESVANINHPDFAGDKAAFVDMARKMHRRDSSSLNLEWTTKMYMLVTSGYLLQYSADGTHDRLPEKVVQLTKDSAAFASDVIPGRHWVLQVSSVFEDGAAMSHDNRSLLGKFGLREREKRQASDILMIFDSAEDMKGWMTLLRREIEALGGKTPLNETGTRKEDDDDAHHHKSLPTSPTQRPMVVRDPNRFAHPIQSPDMRWDAAGVFDGHELHLDAKLAESLPDHTFDDNSTTNSFVSQDGRQLDGLRDSSNRLSFMSATRTIVTSDSSACNSPIRDSFGSQGSHSSSMDATPVAEDASEPRLRPNAAEIEDRRQSYRTSNMLLDSSVSSTYMAAAHRPHASLSSVQDPPNFSLPHAAARRRAASQGGAATDAVHIAHAAATATATARPPRRTRRPPPSALGSTRPLSIVADSPSSPSPLTTEEDDDRSRSPDSTAMFTWAGGDRDASRASSRGSMQTSYRVDTTTTTSPRKYASTNSLRPATMSSLWQDAAAQQPPTIAEEAPSTRRSVSSIDMRRPSSAAAAKPRSRSPIQRAMAAAHKRASVSSLQRGAAAPASISEESISLVTTVTAPRRESLLSEGGSRGRHRRNGSGSSSITTTTTTTTTPRGFLNSRRSLPQMPQLQARLSSPPPPPPMPLVSGPPPAPPPNKALPPIPLAAGGASKRRSGSIPARMRTRNAATIAGGEF